MEENYCTKIYSINEIKDIVVPIAKKYGLGKVLLFGSYARGEATQNSDIDLRINAGKAKGYFALGGFQYEVSEKLQKPVDVAITRTLRKSFREHIKKEEILFYDRYKRN